MMRFAGLWTMTILFSTVVGAVSAPAGESISTGDAMPMSDVDMKNVDGKEITLDGVKGENGTLVIFSSNTCPWVVAWESRIAEIGNSYQDKGFGVVAINSNDPKVSEGDSFVSMIQRAEKLGLEFPYVVDATSDVARAFGAERTPEIFLFDSENRLVYHGAIDDNARAADQVEQPYLRNALNALTEGSPIQPTETKALGCSIKFRPKKQ